MTAPLTRDQIMRGKNICPESRAARSRKGAAASPWSKGPIVNTERARAAFDRNRKRR